MSFSSFVFNIAAGGTITVGISSMEAKDFNPLHLFFHLATIVLLAIIVGFIAEGGFDKLKKYLNNGMAKRYF